MLFAALALLTGWVLALPLACEAARLCRRLRRGRAASPSPASVQRVAERDAVITAEALVCDRYRIIADLYDTPTARPGRYP
jgi:hypothetical protein